MYKNDSMGEEIKQRRTEHSSKKKLPLMGN